MKTIFTIILAISFLSIEANAQWQNTGPEGGIVYKVVSFNSILLCYTAGGIYRSVDNGNTWVVSNINLPDEINGIVVHKSKFYVSTISGLYNSTDGIVWTSVPAVNPYPVFHSNGINLFGVSAGKTYYSPNDGINWGISAGAYGVTAQYVAITAFNNNLYLGTNNEVWSSINNGASWLSGGGGGLGIGAVYDIKTIAGGVLAAATNGLYKNNNTLTNVGIPAAHSARKIMVLNNKYMVSVVGNLSTTSYFPNLYSSTDGSNWVLNNSNNPTATILSMEYFNSVGFIGNTKGIYRSTDNGNSWSESFAGIKAQSISDIEAAGNKIYAAVSNKLDANRPYSGGIFASADNGGSWQKLSLIDTMSVEKLIVKNDTILAFTYGGFVGNKNNFLYRSTDAGITWSEISGYTNPLYELNYTNNTLFVTTAGLDRLNIDRSMDFGATWQTITASGYPLVTSPLSINTTIGTTIFANIPINVSAGGGIYKSTDNGVTWVAVNNGLPENAALKYLKASGNILFTYANFANASALYRSTDMGANWIQINSDLQQYNLVDIHGGNGSVFATASYTDFGSDSGYVFESKDNGGTWKNISLGLPKVIMNNMTVHNSVLYVAATGQSIWAKSLTATLPVSFITTSANHVSAGIQVSWVVATESGILNYEVERSTDGARFTKVATVAALSNASTHNYNWLDVFTSSGTIYYRIKSIDISGEVKYTKVVKITGGDVKRGFVVSPNPAEGGVVNLQFKNQPEGRYMARLLSISGQTVFNVMAAHSGGNTSHVLNLPSHIVGGTYRLEIIAPDKTRTTQTLFLNTK